MTLGEKRGREKGGGSVEVVQTVVRNVAVLVLITLFLQMLLPSGQLAGFVRMIMGLLLLAALINPVLEFLGREPSLPVFQPAASNAQTEQILQRGQELAGEWQAEASQEYTQGLAQQMEAVALLTPDTSQAQVELELDEAGNVTGGQLTIDYSGDEDLNAVRNRLSRSLQQYFALPEGALTIMVRSGGRIAPPETEEEKSEEAAYE